MSRFHDFRRHCATVQCTVLLYLEFGLISQIWFWHSLFRFSNTVVFQLKQAIFKSEILRHCSVRNLPVSLCQKGQISCISSLTSLMDSFLRYVRQFITLDSLPVTNRGAVVLRKQLFLGKG